MLAPWEDQFKRVAVRLYPPEGQELIEAFAEAAGLSWNRSLLGELGRANTTPTARLVEFTRQFHLLLQSSKVPQSQIRQLLNVFRAFLSAQPDESGAFVGLTPEIADRIRMRFVDTNREVARRHFGREVLFEESCKPNADRRNIYRFSGYDDALQLAGELARLIAQQHRPGQ